MSLPAEKVTELKQIIHSHLNRINVQSAIQEALSDSINETDSGDASIVGEHEILEALRKKGIVDDIMRQLQIGQGHGTLDQAAPMQTPSWQTRQYEKPATHFVDKDKTLLLPLNKANIDPARRYLYLQVIGGKAFLEHLQEPEPLPGQLHSTFTLHIHFRGQRFKSQAVPCSCEPDFKEGFLLELHKDKSGDAARMADSVGLLSMPDVVHLVLLKTEPSGDTHLLSSHSLEWRGVLSSEHGRQSLSVEFMGVGEENKVPVGIIDMKLELIPRPEQSLADDVVSTQVNMEHSRVSERERLFLVYAKQWWKEYLQIRETHHNRLVKIFAQDENGVNRLVCSFVHPLRSGRLLDSPRHAARFVSVIGYDRSAGLGGGHPKEQWSSMHAFLCKNKGDCEDHANLLCSLLLGFGLNAYVCIGTKARGAPHSWVVTVSQDGSVIFWESLTGYRYIHHPIDPDDPPTMKQSHGQYPYRTIGCIYNHTSFYANSQPTDHVDACRFDLRDESLWKAMSQDAVQSVASPENSRSWTNIVPLISNALDAALVSNDMELHLRSLVTDHRKDLGLTTVWDDELSYLLTPALASYEMERTMGISVGNEEFQQAIRSAVPDGHTFKGFPIQFVHRNARRSFATCLRSSVCEEIICCRGDHVRLAVRVKVYCYPEKAMAVWVMFACKYKSVL